MSLSQASAPLSPTNTDAENGLHASVSDAVLYGAPSDNWFAVKYRQTLADLFGRHSDTFGGACPNLVTQDSTDRIAAAPGNSRGLGT